MDVHHVAGNRRRWLATVGHFLTKPFSGANVFVWLVKRNQRNIPGRFRLMATGLAI
jgi:hypothetical protein